MISLIVDTNIYSEFMKGDPILKDIFKRSDMLYFPFIVIGELLFGFKLGSKEKENKAQLENFLSANRISVLYPNERTLEMYSLIAAELRRNGTPIPTNDIWIAALARQYHYPLCTFDGHFSVITDISVVTDKNSFELSLSR